VPFVFSELFSFTRMAVGNDFGLATPYYLGNSYRDCIRRNCGKSQIENLGSVCNRGSDNKLTCLHLDHRNSLHAFWQRRKVLKTKKRGSKQFDCLPPFYNQVPSVQFSTNQRLTL